MKNRGKNQQGGTRRLGHNVLSAIQILVIFVMTVVGYFQPAQVAAAAGPVPRTPGPHIMPFNAPAAGPRILQSAPSGAHLTYYGGPVISNMKSIDVGYGPGTYISSGTPATWIPIFTQQYLGSGVMDWLNEYNTAPLSGGSHQYIGRGSYAGTITIFPSASNNGATIQDSQVQAELNAQIGAGLLPEPDSNTSYALFFRPGQTICEQGSCSLVAGGFCAYHSTFTAPNGVVSTYQVMPDMAGQFGCGNSTDLNNTTSVLSHELIETLTDPQVGFATNVAPPLGWYDSTNGEIGDICNAQQDSFVGTDGNTYTLQQMFSNIAKNCITTQTAVPNNFSISASPASLNIAQGASDVSTISTAVTSGSAASVSLSVSGAPAGVSASLSPASMTAGGGSTLSVAVDLTTTPGSYTLTVSGTEGANTHSTTVSLTVPAPVVNDFSISASPASLNIALGAADVSTISTAVTSGAAASVSLSVSGAPAGVTASLSPASVTASGSATLSVAVDVSTVPGSYTLTVSGTEGANTHSTTVSLTVPAPVVNDFSISASPASLNIALGAADVSTISTAVTSGAAASVNLSVSGAPAGVTASLSPASVTASGSATLSVAVDVSTVPGSYTLTVSGTEGAFTHSTTVSLTVPAPVVNDFSISASPASINVAQGAVGSATISTAVTSGAAASVNLSLSGAPAGVTASLSPASVTAGSSSTLSVAVGASTVPGTYTLTVSGTEGANTHSTTVSLTVPVPVVNDFSISASPASINVAQGAAGSATISTAVTSGAAGTVSLSVSGAPAGVTASLSPASVSAGGSSTLSVSVGAATIPGSYTLTVSGTEGANTHSATVSLTVPVVNDFSISASPASINVAQGAAGSATISTAVTSGAAGTVSLSVSGAPAGVTASLSPAAVTAGGSANLSVSVGASSVPGSYTLTVSGTEGAITHSTTVALTVTASVVPFPSTAVLDSFNRANGGVGSNWTGNTSTDSFRISSNLLKVQYGGLLAWKPTSFGTNQEAFVTLSTLDSRSKAQGLMLKVQTSTNTPGAIVVAYDKTSGKVKVSTWRLDGTVLTQYSDTAAVFANGDQLGAQALASGKVKIYQNGRLIATITLNSSDQAFFNSKGGRIGLAAVYGSFTGAFDNFGGGNITP